MATSETITRTLSEVEPLIKARFNRKLSGNLGVRFDVDDLFQVTCMKAHMSRDKARAETPEQLRHWILTIAKSSYLTAVASNFAAKRDIRKERLERGAEPFAKTPEPIDVVVAEHTLPLVKKYLHRLSPDSQKAIELRYLEQKGYPEIAKQIGKTENAIRLLVSRGLRALKKMKHRL